MKARTETAIVGASITILALAFVALATMVVQMSGRPELTEYTGTVVTVSNHAIVVKTDDGRVDGLLASSNPVHRGDKVTVRVLSDPDVIYVVPPTN